MLFFVFALQTSTAQSFDLREMDALVVRLESGRNKTKVIQEKLEAANSSEMKKYWQRELENTKLEIQTKNQFMRNAFEQEFKFAKVFYIYDYAAKDLKNGIVEGIFLNEKLESDPLISLEGKNFLLAAEGRSTSSSEGIYLHHSNMARLQNSYLNFVKLNTLGLFFNNMFSSTDARERMYTVAVQKLNRRFYKSQRLIE